MHPSFLLAELTKAGPKLDLYIFPVIAIVIAIIIWLFLWYFWKDCSDDGLFETKDDSVHTTAPASPANVLTSDKTVGTVSSSERKIETSSPAPSASSAIKPDKAGTGGLVSGATPSENQKEQIEFKTATEKEAASLFAGDLSDGTVKQDAVYGILYITKPDESDDLKLIKGVANVLEGKLNEIGVYRFKQVAVWTEPACIEFSKMMTSFKDRIYRDNWIAQAKQFHFDKYGEKL